MKNKVSLIGRVGQAPEILRFENGNTLAKFSLATTERYKDSKGEIQEATTWHNVTTWGKQAEIIEKYVTKGMLLGVEGSITNRQYETKEGEKRTATEIKCDSFYMLSKSESKEQTEDVKPSDFETMPNNDLPF